MKTKCYLVKIKSITPRGDAYLIEDYNGNSDFFPKSTVFDDGYNIYIACWILEKKSITYSRKKTFWYNPKTASVTEHVEIIKVTPPKIEFDPNSKPNKDLLK